MANQNMLRDAQEFLQAESIPGWLIYDYLGCNPVLHQVAAPSGHVTRPVFLYVPAFGPTSLLTHHVDAGKFADAGISTTVYSSRASLESALGETLQNVDHVAMEYSPRNGLPRVSRVDAGTIELVQSMGPQVVSSADLMQYATQRWTAEQLAGHQRAARKLGEIVNEAFGLIGQRLHQHPSEFEIAEFIRSRFREEGLTTTDGPIVSTNAHCSDPHYEPAASGSNVIRAGDWVLIDLWAREDTPGSVYADITWTAYVGTTPPDRHQEVFSIVLGARDAALAFLVNQHAGQHTVQGWQVDDVARRFISDHGYGEYFTHRLGHSIFHTVHGEGVNLDNFETHDTRRIIPGIGFSIEPGIYLPEFGVRSEIDAYMSADGPYASSPVQREIVHKFRSLVIDVVTFPNTRVLRTPAEVNEATGANHPLVGRTEIKDPQRPLRYVIEYPIKTMNFMPKDNSYQIDTGPLLVPDFDLEANSAIDRLEMAHVAFNHKHPNLAEFILRKPTPVTDDSGKELCQILHYSKVRVDSARNTLLAGMA